jgi:hypothetical protein
MLQKSSQPFLVIEINPYRPPTSLYLGETTDNVDAQSGLGCLTAVNIHLLNGHVLPA